MISVIIKLLLINCFVEACDNRWMKYGSSCYLMFDESRNMTFGDAKNFCHSHTARLPTFNNYTEYKIFSDMFASWGDFWLGYWYDLKKKSMTFTGYPSGEICIVGRNLLNKYVGKNVDKEKGNCIINLDLTIGQPALLLYLHENCNAYYHFVCQKPENSDECPNIETTTTTTSATPNATTEIETSTTPIVTSETETTALSIVTTELQTSAITNTKTKFQTSTISNSDTENESKQMFLSPSEIHEMKSTTTSHGKVLADQKDSPSKGKQTIVYIIVPICVIGLLVVIIVVAVLLRRRARKKAVDGAISSKLSNKPYPILTFGSVSEATKMKSQPKTNQKSFLSSLQKTLDKSQRKSKVNSLQKTQQKTQQKTMLKTQLKAQPTMLEDIPENNKKASMPYHDFTPTKPTTSQKKGIKSTSKSRSQEAEEESDYETVK